MAGGVSAAEARRRALARFGSLPPAADQCRDQRGIAFFETLSRDLGFAIRTFRRAPLVAVTVVSTIALGLGVAAVAFTSARSLRGCPASSSDSNTPFVNCDSGESRFSTSRMGGLTT